jgi:hypothetical protein
MLDANDFAPANATAKNKNPLPDFRQRISYYNLNNNA